jgi:hypothetical protein
MSASLFWRPISERRDLGTWRPSSFITRCEQHFGHQNPYVFGQDDVDWLREVAADMGLDGGGNSEAGQLLTALEKHVRVIVEVEF